VIDRISKPEEQSVDSDYQTDKVWLLNVQRKLYQWSLENPEGQYLDMWNWVTDPHNLRYAWRTVATNKGRRTPGIDGETVRRIKQGLGEAKFLEGLRQELRCSSYVPSPSRRKLIPKPGRPGEFRPLGIPTVKDRVVQCAIKQIVEPLFEARFWHISYGFRPGRGCHGALEHIRMAMRPRVKAEDGKRHTMPYQWVIEGDIKGCFDNIDHHHLMERVRKRVGDRKVSQTIMQFLKAGVLSEDQFIHTEAGTPQGGIISPLLANIALSVIEERYERWVNHQHKIRAHRTSDGITAAMNIRMSDRKAGRPVFFPIRYADDFIVLSSGTFEDVCKEKQALEEYLREETGLRLSPEKTHITTVEDGFNFLGHRIRMRWDERYGFTPRIEIPKTKILDIRYRIKQITSRRNVLLSLPAILHTINPILRGWGNFYRFCTGAKRVLSSIDWYVSDRLWRWMQKKHPNAGAHDLARLCILRRSQLFQMGQLRVQRFQRGWMHTPDYAVITGEPEA